MTNFDILNKEEKRKAINHKYEYELKQSIFDYWRHRDITGTSKALEQMEKDFNLLKQFNSNSEYISKCQNYIIKCKKECQCY